MTTNNKKYRSKAFLKPASGLALCTLLLQLSCSPDSKCRIEDLSCTERGLPAILWVSSCNYRPTCESQTVEAPGGSVAFDSSVFADCQRINIAHGDNANGDLRFARSNDGGLTWYTTIVDDGSDT